ncbi:electron transfer flavoprotein subunit beta/FixA family protein [uncultured Ilyobacter sp.]|uniref:electron transfer flavoprotein subunit beta/FixA family protein n=1 Tax=uncultured Ilyobacter sp. TaxID=544433 RepID=UPI0029F4C99B|nr:electron transfer flavoprotein subunit beta/FixA family protein [uncultured Ilyobacter sp.]
MKIAVCAKQVPHRNEGRMDTETGLIKRGELISVTNVYDLVAIETGLKIKEQVNDAVIDIFTMAPQRGREVIIQGYSMGVDNGFLLCDNSFTGSDVFATSYTLSCGIKKVDEYDLIICGKQTTDGDTGQVGSGIASWLGIPYISNVSKIVSVDKKTAVFLQILDDIEYKVEVNLPCTISVLKEVYIPRMPTLTLKLKGKKKKLTTLNYEDLTKCDIEKIGAKGSPTKVIKVYPAPVTEKRDLIKINYKDASKLILDIIMEVDDNE